MGVDGCQPLAKRKDVHGDVESEGNVISKVPARGIRIASGVQSGMSLQYKTKSNKLHGYEDVNVADMWDESCGSCCGRPYGRAETRYEIRLKQDLS